MNTLIILWALIASTFASEEYQTINIYVDITEVHAPDGSSGTSIPLNLMITKEAQRKSLLEHRLQYLAAHKVWEGEINVWDWRNITYMPSYSRCDYSDAVKCGTINKHWTLRTIVSVGDKFSVFQTLLYDEYGRVIGTSNKTAWGKIRWKPQWKLTKIKEAGGFGGKKETEIFEMWPPKMEEIPPLITPAIVGQSVFGFYGAIDKSACRLTFCRK
tara:strand:+ start:226 stop:870 length:645 start_codon:yes stop_codon:yes gene_type:complete